MREASHEHEFVQPVIASPRTAALEALNHDSLPPLASDEDVVDLRVTGFGGAVASLPVGATSPRPVIVVGHGSLDRPDWQCHNWSEVVGDSAFVLCLRGIIVGATQRWPSQRFTYAGTLALRREVDTALRALHDRFGAYVSNGPIAYMGFSLGAMLGQHVCASGTVRCSYEILIEGSPEDWTPERVRAFTRRGGRRVLFACVRTGCLGGARSAARRFAANGGEANVVFGAGVGHHYIGNVKWAVADGMSWLFADDPAWAGVMRTAAARWAARP